VAACSNSGGCGTIGGIGLSPEALDAQIKAVKALLRSPDLPFGVDLLLPKVGEGAKKTNKDYTGGKLGELLDVVINNQVPLFVCAVGVPPKWACEKLHQHGIVVMNMVGDPRHVAKALEVGCDMICAQGTEGGGHTGDIASMVLIPQCVEKCRGAVNFFGQPVGIIGAGGIYNGHGIAAVLALGAVGVWIGTAFLCAEECNIESGYQQKIIQSSAADTVVQRYYSGRTMRVISNAWVEKWRGKDPEAQAMLAEGQLPSLHDLAAGGNITVEHVTGSLLFPGDMPVDRKGQESSFNADFAPMLAGQAIGGITSVRPVADIMSEMMNQAISVLRSQPTMIARL